MKLRLPHAPYIGNKIALDLSNCGFVNVLHGIEPISKIAQKFIEEDIKEEMRIEEKAREILEEKIEDIGFETVKEG